ncbi:MAG: radical SAM protein [Planctomycetota bacterium]|nr:radical SAM protein [Planctomycetota bacterium]
MDTSRENKIPRESENILRLAEDLSQGRVVWQSRPTEVEFGFNNDCNLTCIMCHQADGIPRKEMEPGKAKDVLDQVLPWALHLTPSDASEPLMNDLDVVCEFCEKHNVQMLLYCNATLLDEEVFAKIAPWTHRIWFSIDSPHKETFEQLRTGSNFEEVVENIRKAMPLCRQAGIEVGFNAVVMSPNWDHMPDLVDFVADLGGDSLALQELLPNSTGYEDLKIEGAVDDEAYGLVVESVKARAVARGINVELNLHQPFGGEIRNVPDAQGSKAPLAKIRELHMDSLGRMYGGFCSMAMNYTKITPDGKVYPCCRGPEELEMGNVLEDDFETIWNGEAYQEFRRKMFAGDYPEVCATCVVLTGTAHFPGNQEKEEDS